MLASSNSRFRPIPVGGLPNREGNSQQESESGDTGNRGRTNGDTRVASRARYQTYRVTARLVSLWGCVGTTCLATYAIITGR